MGGRNNIVPGTLCLGALIVIHTRQTVNRPQILFIATEGIRSMSVLQPEYIVLQLNKIKLKIICLARTFIFTDFVTTQIICNMNYLSCASKSTIPKLVSSVNLNMRELKSF